MSAGIVEFLSLNLLLLILFHNVEIHESMKYGSDKLKIRQYLKGKYNYFSICLALEVQGYIR